jgi:hypothetical protein
VSRRRGGAKIGLDHRPPLVVLLRAIAFGLPVPVASAEVRAGESGDTGSAMTHSAAATAAAAHPEQPRRLWGGVRKDMRAYTAIAQPSACNATQTPEEWE